MSHAVDYTDINILKDKIKKSIQTMNKNLDELKRIKELMNYGLTENKKQYSSVEHSKEAADGKVYGIVREGTKYYIKVSKDKKNLIKENFDYIGGFMNRKRYEYNSFANALKQFDLKMMSIREAKANGKDIIIESWNPEKKEFLALESTNKMRQEIMRQRQIMENAKLISEGKCCTNQPFCDDVKDVEDCEGVKQQGKDNISGKVKPKKGKSIKETADRLAWHHTGQNAQGTIADTYMDKSHGTEIGDGKPFNKAKNSEEEMENGVVEEHNTSMTYASDNQNNPEPGTGPIGKDDPFNKKGATQIKEDIDDLDDSSVIDDEDYGGGFNDDGNYGDDGSTYDAEYDDQSMEGDELGDDSMMEVDDDEPYEDDSTEYELETDGGADDLDTYDDLNSDADLGGEGGDVESRLSSIESTLNTILDKLDNIDSSEFEDDDLYPEDGEGDDFGDDDFGDDSDEGDDLGGDDFSNGEGDDLGGDDLSNGEGDDLGGDDFSNGEGDDFGDDSDEDDDSVVYESRSYRKMRLAEENRLDDFGKHPAYRKEPMKRPETGVDKNSHGRDWNHSSVHSEEPYGQKIGDGSPFSVNPEEIENAIVESVMKLLKKK